MEDRFHGTKPWFVKKLPSRIEILEGSTFDMFCRMGRRGCRPWFVKSLPAKIEVPFGAEVETCCLVTSSENECDVTGVDDVKSESLVVVKKSVTTRKNGVTANGVTSKRIKTTSGE